MTNCNPFFLLILSLFFLSIQSCESTVETTPSVTPTLVPSSKTTGITLKEIEEKAKPFTVKIINEPGDTSGIIFRSKDNIYSVITTGHTFTPIQTTSMQVISPDINDSDVQKSNNHEKYVVTSDAVSHLIDVNSIKRIPGLDLAIFKFKNTTDVNYPSANFSKMPTEDQKVYLFGYKNCVDKKVDSKETNKGKIIKHKSKLGDDGYHVNYSNPSIEGMSGSPLLDSQGNVIAIHGRSQKDKSTIQDSALENCAQSLPSSFGDNWGIPVDTFAEQINIKF